MSCSTVPSARPTPANAFSVIPPGPSSDAASPVGAVRNVAPRAHGARSSAARSTCDLPVPAAPVMKTLRLEATRSMARSCAADSGCGASAAGGAAPWSSPRRDGCALLPGEGPSGRFAPLSCCSGARAMAAGRSPLVAASAARASAASASGLPPLSITCAPRAPLGLDSGSSRSVSRPCAAMPAKQRSLSNGSSNCVRRQARQAGQGAEDGGELLARRTSFGFRPTTKTGSDVESVKATLTRTLRAVTALKLPEPEPGGSSHSMRTSASAIDAARPQSACGGAATAPREAVCLRLRHQPPCLSTSCIYGA